MPAKAYHTVVAHDAIESHHSIFWSFGRGYGPRLDTMAMMDNSIFGPHVGGEEASSSLDEEEVIQVGTWVRFKGRIVPADDERVRDLNLERLKGTKVVQAILEQKMDVPGSFGTVGSDGEEDDSAGKEADNGEDLDEDDLTSIDDELDEQMSDTLIPSGDEDA